MKYAKQALHSAYLEATSSFDSWAFLLNFAVRVLRVVFLISVWKAIFTHNVKSPIELNLSQIVTYTVVTESLYTFLMPQLKLTSELWTGVFSRRFLRPVDIYTQLISEYFGGQVWNFCLFSVPLFVGFAFFERQFFLMKGVDNFIFFTLSIALAMLIGFALEFIYAAFMLFVGGNEHLVHQVKTVFLLLMSGAMIPLDLLPWQMGKYFDYLPFAAMVSIPLKIYLGAENVSNLIFYQFFWVVLLWPLALFVWKCNRERLMTYGG